MKKYLRHLSVFIILVMLCGSLAALADDSGVSTVSAPGKQLPADNPDSLQRNYNDSNFVTDREQYVAVGVDDRGNIVYAADTEEFANVNYVVINENQEEISVDDYLDDFENLEEYDEGEPEDEDNYEDYDRENDWEERIAEREQNMQNWEDPRRPIEPESQNPSVNPVVSPIVTPVVSPIVTPAVSPIVTPVVSPIVTPAVSPIVTPVVSSIPDITQAPAPVNTPVYSEEMDSSGIRSVIDIRDYIVDNKFDFDRFEVNTELDEQPTAVTSAPQKIDTDPVFNIYYPQEELVKEPTTVVEPGRADYYIGIEVGRIAHLYPTYEAMNTFTVEDKTIIGEPYQFNEAGFEVNYRAHAYKPGDTTITCTHETNHVVDFIEVWHVHVYCRDISFGEDRYVVEKKGTANQYLTLQLPAFEYAIDMAYDFVWTSSNTSVAYVGSGWKGTNCYLAIKSAGVSTITVTDKYGNTRSTLLVVKPDPEIEAQRIAEEKAAEEARIAAEKAEKARLEKIVKQKKNIKGATVMLKTKNTSKSIKLTWTQTSKTKPDGYIVYVSTTGKKYKKIATLEGSKTLSYSHTGAKSGKTYYYKVRGYKVIDGKTVYTPYSAVKKIKKK